MLFSCAWLPLLALPPLAARKTTAPTLLQLRTKEVLHQTRTSDVWTLLENAEGNCLQASTAAGNGEHPRMTPCDPESAAQHWVYDDDSGLIKHASGKCLDASQRNVNHGIIHLWDCDASNKNQMWRWSEEKKQVKNRYGRCMDAPNPMAGSGVHMWTCHKNLQNQQWLFVPSGSFSGTTATTTTATEAGPSSSSARSSTTVGPSSTTSTSTPQPLSALRNCQLEPLAPGAGCQRLAVLEHEKFGVGENGQETQGRHECLEMMRTYADADSFVHYLGRCEIWRCVTQARLKMSAGPGGAVSSSPNAIALIGHNGRYLTADQAGGMHATEESFVPEALFSLEEQRQGYTLKSKATDRFLKAEPGGHVSAVTEKWDDWEIFQVEHLSEEGSIALKSFHQRYVTVGPSGSVWAGARAQTSEAVFRLENRSRAAWEAANSAQPLRPLQTVSATAGDSCSWPSGSAAVRCCEDGRPVSEASYGCHNRKTFEEAVSICEEHGLTLCAAEDVFTCPECQSCAEAGEHQQLWTSSSCSSTEQLTQRRLNLRNDRAAVFSELCSYESQQGGLHGEEPRATVLVKLMEWNYNDIAKECTEYLAPNGFEAVQVSPVTEHIIGYQWWVKYQPVSAGLDSRSGTEAEFRQMVATCRAAGIQVVVDILMNHMAGPCKKARQLTKSGGAEGEDEMPCAGWGGSKFGDRKQKGARGWDASRPEHFHHKADNVMEPLCKVGPQTGWLCPNDDCTPCDMYKLPDYNTELQEVRTMQFKHLEELFHIGVTGLRVDAAIYHHVYELADMLNRVPWDLVYQEWWGEYPPQDRTDYVGLYRDVAYRWHVVNRLSGKNATELPELLNLTGGVFGISEDMAVYPFAYHDGRSRLADPEIATYKNGLAYHQQQKFFLSWVVGSSVLVWGGYGWRDLSHGPPGCDKSDGNHCTPKAVYAASGRAQCMETPMESPMPRAKARQRRWICEHRWQGVAGMIHFRKACRGKALTQTWSSSSKEPNPLPLGRLAFQLGADCFVALVRGRRKDQGSQVDVVGVGGTWDLIGFGPIALPEGLYCDLSSLATQKSWKETDPCPRSVQVDSQGIIQEGHVTEGDLLAIHRGARAPLAIAE